MGGSVQIRVRDWAEGADGTRPGAYSFGSNEESGWMFGLFPGV